MVEQLVVERLTHGDDCCFEQIALAYPMERSIEHTLKKDSLLLPLSMGKRISVQWSGHLADEPINGVRMIRRVARGLVLLAFDGRDQ